MKRRTNDDTRTSTPKKFTPHFLSSPAYLSIHPPPHLSPPLPGGLWSMVLSVPVPIPIGRFRLGFASLRFQDFETRVCVGCSVRKGVGGGGCISLCIYLYICSYIPSIQQTNHGLFLVIYLCECMKIPRLAMVKEKT